MNCPGVGWRKGVGDDEGVGRELGQRVGLILILVLVYLCLDVRGNERVDEIDDREARSRDAELELGLGLNGLFLFV